MTTVTNNDYQVKGVFNRMKYAVHLYNEMESKVLQATNADAWGAPSSLMRALAQGSMESDKLNVIMPALYRRMTVKDTRQWLQVYKGLVLLEYLIKYGDDQVLVYVQSHMDVFDILKSFEFLDEKGQDKGYNVRVRSKTVEDLVKDPEQIKHIKENGRLSQDRFVGVSSNDIMSSTPSSPDTTAPTSNAAVTNPSLIASKQLPSIHPQQPEVMTLPRVEVNTTTPVVMQEEQQLSAIMKEVHIQQPVDEMDNVIFREDFIDPLDEDNHAMVFPPNGGKGKATKLPTDDFTDDDDASSLKNKNKKKKAKKESKPKQHQHRQQQQQQQQQQPEQQMAQEVDQVKKKSRFSFGSVFSRSKRASVSSPSEIQENIASNDKPADIMPIPAVVSKSQPGEEDDGWGDFASPESDTIDKDILFQQEDTKQKEDYLLDLDCDTMTTSTARTSVDNNDMLLDLDMTTFNHPYPQQQEQHYPPQYQSQSYGYAINNNTMMTMNQATYHYHYQTPKYEALPSLTRNDGSHYGNSVPTPTTTTPSTPFGFDAFGHSDNMLKYDHFPEMKVPLGDANASPTAHQLTQHWYPWMATNGNSTIATSFPPLPPPQQQYHQHYHHQQHQQLQQLHLSQRSLTVDDLLS